MTQTRHLIADRIGRPIGTAEELPADGRQSERALEISRGCQRLLRELGYAPISEFVLTTGRRADIAAVSAHGDVFIVEVKSSLADFRADQKWEEYRDYCDRFAFAVAPDFPREVLPTEEGLVVGDKYGAAIVIEPRELRLSAARRKAVLIDFARTAALRIHALFDPAAGNESLRL